MSGSSTAAAAGKGQGAPFAGASRLPVIVVAAVTFLVTISAIGNWPVGVFQDDGIYLILAKSLAQGDGYRYLNLPGTPNATHYPPGYPALLALLWLINPKFPQNVGMFTFVNAGLLSLASVFVYHFARRHLSLGTVVSAVVSVATMATVPMLMLGTVVLSEPMFVALLIPVLVACERAAKSGSTRDAIVAGVAGGALALIRTLGIVAIPATIIVLAWRRRWRAATVVLAAGVATLAPWQLWVAANADAVPGVLQGKYGSYSGWLLQGIREGGVPFVRDVVMHNLNIVRGLGWGMFSPDTIPNGLRDAGAFAVLLLLLLGMVGLARRAPTALWFLVGYSALVISWPFDPTRFLWAILPLFGFLLALAPGTVAHWSARLPRTAGLAVRGVTMACLIALLIGFADYTRRGVADRAWEAVPALVATRSTPLVKWVMSSTKPTDLLLTDDDALVYLYTGRRTAPIATFTPQEFLTPQTHEFVTQTLAELMQIYEADYVLASTRFGIFSAQALLRRSPGLRYLGSLRTGAVYAPSPPA